MLHLFELQYLPYLNNVILLFQYVTVTFKFSELVKQSLLYIHYQNLNSVDIKVFNGRHL
jgi:hypothetical protein